ncbi:MAG TPA: hypothetical protein VFW84_15600 [Aquabacterium sp.]|uniref:hypothetical protein n=1 Tax=Aquabacterium sp. TaxID=1872578 RepID=UPI002E35A328|nr:hypothetical protein [Aquabacterium sp.]HEX5374150.1 hypothetical protein [Aquabacterium sp.]
MPIIAYPDELKKAFWDKKKGSLDGAADLQELLKALQKKHEAIDWPKLAAGWAKGVADPDRLQALFDALDKLYRTKAAPLKLEATALGSAADKAAKAKDATKPLKDATALISRAAATYAKAIAAGLDELEAEFTQARKAVPSDQGAEEDEPSSALIDPKRLLKQLQLCKADPKRQVHFAMLDDGKQPPVLVLHQRLSGRTLLAKLIKELSIKTGAFGLVSLDGTDLKLVVEKKVSGLVKRIRIPIRACGFKLGKVALLDDKGNSLDEDLGEDEQGETEADESGSTSAAPSASAPAPGGAAEALAAWSRVREVAITALKGVAGEIAALKDPESAKAVIEISAVVKNLTAEPHTPAQVAELMRYIDKDDVVLDVSELAHDIRTPLLKALMQLHKVLPA